MSVETRPPTMSSYSFESLVRAYDQTDDDDIDVYEFSNGRTFKNTDGSNNGFYSGS